MKHIRNEFDGFIEIEKLYREYQIPYKKGILFYGPPGTGKTSLVKALAFEYQLPLYIIDVNDDEINDDSIVTILNGLGNSGLKLLLFEDIDTAFADKEKVRNETKLSLHHNEEHENKDNDSKNKQIIKKKFLTYSGLLNALDGVMSNQSGVITIMTTNYIERLGPAFLRPGRIDVKFQLKECNDEQIEQMTKTFLLKRMDMAGKIFADETLLNLTEKDLDQKIHKFVKKLVNSKGESLIKPCELQFYLLRYIRNIEDIFENYNELLEE
jgi:chaperone BCS1